MDNCEKMLLSLEPEIDKKCNQIKKKNKEKLLTKLFIYIGLAVLIIPTILVFTGIKLIAILAPMLILSILFIILSPLLLYKGGFLYE